MPENSGMVTKKRLNASSPPADAPIPTTGKSELGKGALSSCLDPVIIKFNTSMQNSGGKSEMRLLYQI